MYFIVERGGPRPLARTPTERTVRPLAAGPRGRRSARRQLSVLAVSLRPLVDEQVVLGVEQMLEARRDELLAGEVHHDALVVEALGPDLVGAHLGVLDGAEVDERLALEPVDQRLVHIVLAVALEVVEQVGVAQLLAHAVQPEDARGLALAEAQLDRVVADALAAHAAHGLDDTADVAELDEGVGVGAVRLLLLVVLQVVVANAKKS